MKEIKVKASKEYSIFVADGLLSRLGEYAAQTVSGRKAMLVTGSEVSLIYAEAVRKNLEQSGFHVCCFEYPSGEQSKNIETLAELLELAAENELDPEDVFIALGGGVTGDLTGLAAALYKRGTACVQVPTTLLAMVDSSVGGKTAVNLKSGKNLAGIIRQPALVLCDTTCLSTLPERIVSEGWAEIIKYAFLDEKIYTLVSGNADMEDIICACVEYKSSLVADDELDKGQRRLLNFGHTIGHAIEWCADFELLHGEAVAIGMSTMTRGCEKLGLCEDGLSEKLVEMLENRNLPTHCGYSAAQLMMAAREDKKRSGDEIDLVIPSSAGHCTLERYSLDMLEKIINAGL